MRVQHYASAVLLLLALACPLVAGQTPDALLEVCRPPADVMLDQGISIREDPTCATSTNLNGCINVNCRFCWISTLPLALQYLPCEAPIKLPEPVVIVPGPPAPIMWTPVPVTPAPLPVPPAQLVPAPITPAPSVPAPVIPALPNPAPADPPVPAPVSTTPQTQESASVIGFATAPTVSGGSDIPAGNADEPLTLTASTLSAGDTDAPAGTKGAWTTCLTVPTAVETVQHGLKIVTDLNCQLADGKFPYGCLSSVCRYCSTGSGTVDTNSLLMACM